MKIIVHYLQVIASLKYFYSQYPSFGLLYVDYLGDPIDKATFAFDCVLSSWFSPSTSMIPFEYTKIISSSTYQASLLVIYAMTYLLLIKLKRVVYKNYAVRNAAIFFAIFVQNSFVAQLVSALACRDIGNKSYMRFAISKECYTDDYITYTIYLVLPLLLLWAFIIPAIGFSMVFRVRSKLFTLFNTLNYGLLYLEYKPSRFYWEFIKIMEKTLLTFAVNFFGHNPYFQGITALFIIIVYFKLLAKYEPYNDTYFYTLEKRSSLMQILYFFLILFQIDL